MQSTKPVSGQDPFLRCRVGSYALPYASEPEPLRTLLPLCEVNFDPIGTQGLSESAGGRDYHLARIAQYNLISQNVCMNTL